MQLIACLLQRRQALRFAFKWNAFGSCISHTEVVHDGIKALPHRKLEPLLLTWQLEEVE